MKAYPYIRSVFLTNQGESSKGSGAARNAGAIYDDGRPFSHVFFLDCDCVVPEGFVEALRARLEANQGGIVMPIVRDSETGERRPATGDQGLGRLGEESLRLPPGQHYRWP